MARHARDLYGISALRRLSADEVINRYAGVTIERFKRAAEAQNMVPVVVPAHDEQEDLPATLVSIALSGAVAVVVNNRSVDRTADVAKAMGAHVVEAPYGKKMAATQAGIRYVLGAFAVPKILFTDADTLVGSRWATTLDKSLQAADHGQGAVVCGDSLAWYGPSRSADTLVNLMKVPSVVRRAVQERPPHVHGHNYGLSFDAAGKVEQAIMDLDPDLFVGSDGMMDDIATVAAVREAGASVTGVREVEGWVLTRGDRMTTLRQAASMLILRRPYHKVVSQSYENQY